MSASFSVRTFLLKAGMLLFLCVLLLFPASALSGAKNGLLLWFNQVLPSLLPFLILSTLFLSTGLSDSLARRLSPLISPLFRCTASGCYAIVIGLLAGLPVGAKTISSLVEHGKISKKEGQYLLPLCNNPSPLFLLGYVSVSVLNAPELRYPLLFIVIFSSMLSAVLLRPRDVSASYTRQDRKSRQTASAYKKFSFSFLLLDSAIEQAFSVLTRVGGYIILFSVLAELLTKVPFPPLLRACIGSLLEITTGCAALAALPLKKSILFPLITAFITFGGLSTAAQTKSVLAESRLPLAHYLLTKAAAALIAAALMSLYLRII